MTLLTLTYLLAGFILLIGGGEAVVRGAASLGMRMGLSALATGLTIVAFGTSAPELVVNLRAAAVGVSDLAVGNVVGSNIANIGLVLGLSVMVRPLMLDIRVIRSDIFMMIGAGLLAALMLLDGTLGRLEGAILVALVIAYVAFNLRAAAGARDSSNASFEAALGDERHGLGVDIWLLLGGLLGLTFGGDLFVKGAVDLAQYFQVSPALIGLTVVAVGTSLPELATTAIAAYRGHGDMAIGNIVGSNIFNVLSVLGITSLSFTVTRGDVGPVDLGVFFLSALVLLRFIYTDSRMDRWEGAVLFLGFCAYLTWRVSSA